MALNFDSEFLKKNIKKAKNIYVLIAQNPNPDIVAGGLALFLSLKQEGKSVFIACPSPMRVEFSRLVGVDKVAEKIGNRNLVVSFDYVQDGIEKVSYNVEKDKFNLVVQPKSGVKPLDPKSVSYSYSGAEAELVFMIGAASLDSLGSIYQANKKLFTDAHTVSISRFQTVPFAQTTLSNPQASCLSEVVSEVLKKLDLVAKNDIASNLLFGMDYSTQKFSAPIVPGSAFSVAAELFKNGAKRQVIQPSGGVIAGKSPQLATDKAVNEISGVTQETTIPQVEEGVSKISQAMKATQKQKGLVDPPHPALDTKPVVDAVSQSDLGDSSTQGGKKDLMDSGKIVNKPVMQPMTEEASAKLTPNEDSHVTSQTDQIQGDRKVSYNGNNKTPPQDWLEPKIYQGSSKV